MKSETITIQQVIDALANQETPVAARYLFRLSDLEGSDLEKIAKLWTNLPTRRRKAIMEDLEDLGSRNDLLSFESLAMIAVNDAEAEVRLPAVRVLWEFDNKRIAPVFIRLLEKDPDVDIRAAAATGLGTFVLAGELEEIPSNLLTQIENLLLKVTGASDSNQVKQQALESLGYSGRDEVNQLIEKAYADSNKNWKASALAAMGHSADQRWSAAIQTSLSSNLPLLRSHAARAAGELEMKETVDKLIELLDDPDTSVRDASIWSLAQIGGPGIQDTLEAMLEESEDDDDQEFIESALDILALTEKDEILPIFDIDELEELDELDESDEEEIEDYE